MAKLRFARQEQRYQARLGDAIGAPESVPPKPILVVPAALPTPLPMGRSNVSHPLVVSVVALVAPPTTLEAPSTATFFHRTLLNATTLVWNSVQGVTRDQYAVPWNHWATWSAAAGTDRFLRIVPPCWSLVAAEVPFGFPVAWGLRYHIVEFEI